MFRPLAECAFALLPIAGGLERSKRVARCSSALWLERAVGMKQLGLAGKKGGGAWGAKPPPGSYFAAGCCGGDGAASGGGAVLPDADDEVAEGTAASVLGRRDCKAIRASIVGSTSKSCS